MFHSTVQLSDVMVQTARHTMLELQQVLRTLDRELPDTAAAVRLSGLELSDAIEEVSLLRCYPMRSSLHSLVPNEHAARCLNSDVNYTAVALQIHVLYQI